MNRQAILEDTFQRRTDAWSKWGTVEADVLTHLINPMFMGGPRWPGTRQAYRVVRRPGGLLLASDGLSDPFDDDGDPQDCNGLGLEVFVHTTDSIQAVPGSWLFDLVWQVSQLAASNGRIRGALDELEPGPSRFTELARGLDADAGGDVARLALGSGPVVLCGARCPR